MTIFFLYVIKIVFKGMRFEYFIVSRFFKRCSIIEDKKLNCELNLINSEDNRTEYRVYESNNIIDKDAIYSIIEYSGDIVGAVNKIPGAKVYIIDGTRAILAVKGNIREVADKLFNNIVYLTPLSLYTLCDISPLEASGADIFHNNPYLQLDGSGVIVGIIDTGIDYLNEEFINEDDTTRIISIFDQTLETGKKIKGQPLGSEFPRDDINRAIKAKRNGEDPYTIVPSKDEIGHGTNMAGIIGARGTNPEVIGVAPRCSFAIVKLLPANENLRDEFGVYGDIIAFSTAAIFLGMKYLFDLASSLETPIIILIPLGGNAGPHNGVSLIERYIDELSNIKGVVVVVPVGNQGDAEIHTSGKLENNEDIKSIELRVGKNQSNLKFEIWANKPDKLSLSIISPSGEVIDRIPPKNNQTTEYTFLYEGTKIFVTYSIPEDVTGEERITINARGIKEGIWIFKIIGDLVIVGRYDAYLIQRELLAPGTKFLNPDPYITLTLPSTSRAALSVAAYNQNNYSNLRDSGRGYTRDGRIKPEIAAGGVNALTTAVGGGTQRITGTSVAAAVIAGCCALIYQWGVVLGNDKALFSEKVKTYLIRGTSKREGDKYPNPEWGYGTVNMKGVFDNIRGLKNNETRETVSQSNVPQQSSNLSEEQGNTQLLQASAQEQEKVNYFYDDKNRVELIEFRGDIVSAIKKFPNTDVYIIDQRRAVITVPFDSYDKIIKSTPEIVYIVPEIIYTTCDITPVEASQATIFHKNVYLPLDGSDVIVGIIDTGIDYLNEEFINEDGTTRILTILDRTIPGKGDDPLVGPLGTIFTQEQINEAIQAKMRGEDPYAIVPSKDDIGHGTNMAGIVGARGANPDLIGAAPRCSLAIVKLREVKENFKEYFAIYGKEPVFQNTGALLGMKYLYTFAQKMNKPIVIFIPLECNWGPHNGESYVERYINEISSYSGVAVVVPAGNEGNTDTHTSGRIQNTGGTGIIELKVGKNQKSIWFEIWISKPDKVGISITSPTGDVIKKIQAKIKGISEVVFVYEQTRMTIEYFIPEERTGDEKIVIIARNLKEGIWKFTLYGDLIVEGKFNAWLLQRKLLAPDTRFLNPTTETTLTIPSTSKEGITVAFYDQNNKSIVPQSGNGYTRNNIIKPDIAAGGINAITTNPGGGTKVISGSSVAGAVVAGCCALIFQWGIVDGNDPTMFASKVKTYLIRGTDKRPGDVYPNPQWGYGMLNIKGSFDNIRILDNYSNNSRSALLIEDYGDKEYYIGNLFIRLP